MSNNDGTERRPLERLHGFLNRCVTTGFFGKIEVTFQNGRVCEVRVQQTKKLDEL
jgi:hypothetical protein